MGITPKNPADFDPTMGNYKDLRPFRFWCQKVLPLVYDDSLSYYEVLCKLVDYLNKTMEDVGVLHDDVDALHTAYQQLQSYVNDYFSTLDVQQEINNKLDVMASDGTLDALLLPYFNAYKGEINTIVQTQNESIANQNNAINNQNQRITVLSARMDTFASLPDGSTAGDAELLDIRIGGNGITYTSAGAAVRGQYADSTNGTALLGKTETTRYTDDTFYGTANSTNGMTKTSTTIPNKPVLNSINGIMTFAGIGNFQNYGLNPDGSFLPSQRNRVSNNDLMSFDRDIVVYPKAGFRFGYLKYEDSNYTWVGWYSVPRRIPKGTEFLIQIARESEVSEVANVYEFVNALTFTTPTQDSLKFLNPSSPHTITSSEMIQGDWNNGYVVTDPKRICTRELYKVLQDNTFTLTPASGWDVLWGIFNDNNVLIHNSGWISSTDELVVDIPYDGWLFLQMKKTNGDNITPADFEGSFVLAYGVVDTVLNMRNSVNVQVDSYTYGYEVGTIYQDGSEHYDPLKIRSSTFILNNFSKVVRNNTAYEFGLHFYDADKNHLGNTTWLNVNIYNIPQIEGCKFIKFVVTPRSSSASITPSDAEGLLTLSNSVSKVVEGVSESIQSIISSEKTYKYTGEAIPSTHGFNYNLVATMSYGDDITSQDIEYFNGYLFVAFSGNEQIKVYDWTNKELLASLNVNTAHGSSMQFSNEYYDDGDAFPLLYVGGWVDNLIYVIRITNTNNTWSASVVRTLYIPTEYGYFMSPSLDNANNIMYCYGYRDDNYYQEDNKMKIVKCDLTQLTDNDDNTYTPDIISSIETPFMGTMQGHKYYNGRLYIGFADTTSPFMSRLVAVDVNTGLTMTDIDMRPVTMSENEGVCYKIVNNKITWLYSDYTRIFELDF